MRSLGADAAIDYRSARFEDTAAGIGAVLDFAGGDTQRRSFAVLRPGGRLISAVSQPDQTLAAQHGVTAEFFLVAVTTQRRASLAALVAAGALAITIGTVLPLPSAREAHEMLEGTRKQPRGKIVLRGRA